jgi:hypothetical protein
MPLNTLQKGRVFGFTNGNNACFRDADMQLTHTTYVLRRSILLKRPTCRYGLCSLPKMAPRQTSDGLRNCDQIKTGKNRPAR